MPNYVYENWSRFLDDCEMPLDIRIVIPEELLNVLNFINENTQYTMEKRKNEIPLLDILVKRDETGIWMDLYHKSTDT